MGSCWNGAWAESSDPGRLPVRRSNAPANQSLFPLRPSVHSTLGRVGAAAAPPGAGPPERVSRSDALGGRRPTARSPGRVHAARPACRPEGRAGAADRRAGAVPVHGQAPRPRRAALPVRRSSSPPAPAAHAAPRQWSAHAPAASARIDECGRAGGPDRCLYREEPRAEAQRRCLDGSGRRGMTRRTRARRERGDDRVIRRNRAGMRRGREGRQGFAYTCSARPDPPAADLPQLLCGRNRWKSQKIVLTTIVIRVRCPRHRMRKQRSSVEPL